jgi:hypothetical protein
MTKPPVAFIAALAVGAAALAACDHAKPYVAGDVGVASAKPAAGISCFRPDQITGFSAVGHKLLNIRVDGTRVYQLTLMGYCPEIDWAQRAAIQSKSGPIICDALAATVIASSPIGPQECPVTSIRKLSPEEIAALPQKQRP